MQIAIAGLSSGKKHKNGRRLVVFGAAVTLLATLSGCQIVEDVVSGPQPPDPPRKTITLSGPDPIYAPDGSAHDNVEVFYVTLKKLAESDAEISGANMASALQEVGFERSNMQVSFDYTRTNLPADFILISARFDDQCLLGQITHRGRDVFVSEAPAVGEYKTLCLIGETAPL